MHRTIVSFVAIFIIVLLFGMLNAQNFISASNEHIQYFGRWDRTNPSAPSHSWPGVYIITKFEGTSIGARFNDNFNYYNVYIDGELNSIFHPTTSGTADYSLVTGLADSQHTILISKRNETGWISHTFYGFILDSGKTLLEPPERPERKIEFIGDSFTSASGNEAPTNEAPSDVEKYTNIDVGFGPIIARHYGAQYQMTSISGYGMVLDWEGDYTKNVPDRFNRNNIQAEEPVWDFAQWIPNFVVIGLGLNDYSGFGGWEGTLVQSETDLYKERYHEFIATIRDVYPGIKMLAVATHVEWMRTTIAEIVDEENTMGNDDVIYAQYSYYEGGYVNNGHPNVATHYAIADELIDYIDTIDPWVPYVDTNPPNITSLPASPFVSYDADFEIEIVTNSYATVRYDTSDKSYDDMENTFTITGKRDHTLNFSGVHGKDYTLYIRASDMSGNKMSESSVVSFSIDTTKSLLNWYDMDYNDTEWDEGPAKFGQLGGSGTITAVDDVITGYFRKAVEIADPSTITAFGILVRGSDATVVYLNGVEIGRINFFEDVDINYNTYAIESSALNKMFVITDSNLVNLIQTGKNVIAVEMHKAEDESNGISFDAQMINQSNQVIFALGSDWQFYDVGDQPESQVVDKTTDLPRSRYNPIDFALYQNFPNPFNPKTIIRYTVGAHRDVPLQHINLSIYNVLGQKVATLVNKKQPAGNYNVEWNAKDFASGVYYYRLHAGDFVETKKLILLK